MCWQIQHRHTIFSFTGKDEKCAPAGGGWGGYLTSKSDSWVHQEGEELKNASNLLLPSLLYYRLCDTPSLFRSPEAYRWLKGCDQWKRQWNTENCWTSQPNAAKMQTAESWFYQHIFGVDSSAHYSTSRA